MQAPTKTIAIDFDGTLFSSDNWPEIGKPIWYTIYSALAEQKDGADLILWTTRSGKELEAAVAACKNVGLEFTAVNENTPYMKELWGNDPRKVGADEYWDDKSKDDFLMFKSFSQADAMWVSDGERSGLDLDDWAKLHPNAEEYYFVKTQSLRRKSEET